MPYDHETLCLAIGVLLGMLYYQKTGWACGGIITPGVIAMYIGDPWKTGVSLLAGLVTWLLLEALVRFTGVYGRQRLAAAMLIASTLHPARRSARWVLGLLCALGALAGALESRPSALALVLLGLAAAACILAAAPERASERASKRASKRA